MDHLISLFPVFIYIPTHYYYDDGDYCYFRTEELHGIYGGVLGGLFLLACSLSSPLLFLLKQRNICIYLFMVIHAFV